MNSKAGYILKNITDKICLLVNKRLSILALLLMLILYYYPINNGFFRVSFIASILFFFVTTGVLLRKQKNALTVLITFFITPIILLCLPGKSYDHDVFNKIYIENLKKYQEVRYVWGGENSIGIDCSGLIRRALMNSYIDYGVRTLNGELLRESLYFWWHDTSASALLKGYRNQTIPLFGANSINIIETEKLQPGDFAVTSDGVHVLAYLGDNEWIDADPMIKKVIISKPPTKNYGFDVAVVFLRWKFVQ